MATKSKRRSIVLGSARDYLLIFEAIRVEALLVCVL